MADLSLSPPDRERIALPMAGRGWGYPPRVRRFAERLLNQQLWCWGRDILCSDGNLLTRYGLLRHRNPEDPKEGATCYRSDDDDCHVALWGFGVFFGLRRHGGLFVERCSFQPRWAPVESLSLGVHSLKDLRMFERPRSEDNWRCAHRLLREMVGWIVRYETWVQQAQGVAFRQECINGWRAPIVNASDQVVVWRRIRDRCWTSASSQGLFADLAPVHVPAGGVHHE